LYGFGFGFGWFIFFYYDTDIPVHSAVYGRVALPVASSCAMFCGCGKEGGLELNANAQQ
jgi:hypothetical protein